jgi:hypothetical protein
VGEGWARGGWVRGGMKKGNLRIFLVSEETYCQCDSDVRVTVTGKKKKEKERTLFYSDFNFLVPSRKGTYNVLGALQKGAGLIRVETARDDEDDDL